MSHWANASELKVHNYTGKCDYVRGMVCMIVVFTDVHCNLRRGPLGGNVVRFLQKLMQTVVRVQRAHQLTLDVFCATRRAQR